MKRKRRKRERERSRALAVHITLLTIRGQCHRVPSRAGPTSLHLASLGSPFALRLLVLPPSVFSHPVAFRPFVSLAIHARARSPPLPRGFPAPSLSAASLARLDLTLSSSLIPLPLFLFSSAPTEHSHRPFVHKSTEKRFFVSSRLVSLDSFRSFLSFSSPPSSSSSSFLFLRAACALLPPPLPPSPDPLSLSSLYPPTSSLARARYKLFQKFVLLLLSLNHSQRRLPETRALESPVQCATLFAPRRPRQFDDSEGGDGDDESSTSGCLSATPW